MWTYNYTYPSDLYHSGVKGMHWGVRRGPPYPIDSQKNKLEKSSISGKIKTTDYKILDPTSGKRYSLSEGTKITNPTTFAGKGTRNPLDENVTKGLSKQIGGIPSNWKHRKGEGIINDEGKDRRAEIHWFQEESVGKHKFKIKEWFE